MIWRARPRSALGSRRQKPELILTGASQRPAPARPRVSGSYSRARAGTPHSHDAAVPGAALSHRHALQPPSRRCRLFQPLRHGSQARTPRGRQPSGQVARPRGHAGPAPPRCAGWTVVLRPGISRLATCSRHESGSPPATSTTRCLRPLPCCSFWCGAQLASLAGATLRSSR